jgi:hypothetical protein
MPAELRTALDRLTLLLRACQRPHADVLDDLWVAWRAACHEVGEAFHAWCAGDGTYDAVVAAMDREEAAASILATYQARFTND